MEAVGYSLVEDAGSETDLVRRLQGGEMALFEELYRRHAARVYAICLRMSGDVSKARDLTQETFLRVWERIGSFRGESMFSTWLHRLTVNVVLGDHRAETRRPLFVAPEDSTPAAEPASPFPRKPGLRRDLERAIAALPAEARNIFVLHDIEGYRHEEIAEMTGKSAGTSKSQLHRARRLLREALR